MSSLDRKILEELIYEQVKVSVDICKLLSFEEDLALSVHRALEAHAGSPEERRLLTLRFLRRAWKRIGREIQDLVEHDPRQPGLSLVEEEAAG
jgi:hypothetical protein